MSDLSAAASANTSAKTRTMVETALLIAVTIIMGMTPLGTIRTPFLSVSLVTVPVALAAMLIGPMGAFACGTVFGITSFINALTGASGLLSTLFNINPFGVFVTAIIARMLDGIFDGLIFKGLHKVLKRNPLSYYLTGLAAPVLNTVFFMGSLVLFFYNTDYIQEMASGLGAANPMAFIIALVGIQGVIEAIVGCALAGTVGLLVAKALQRR
ncbi:MAG: ECF transporter S component [Eubacterium sp.]|nr:ECF transporter S component [Eubacterium sp.]